MSMSTWLTAAGIWLLVALDPRSPTWLRVAAYLIAAFSMVRLAFWVVGYVVVGW